MRVNQPFASWNVQRCSNGRIVPICLVKSRWWLIFGPGSLYCPGVCCQLTPSMDPFRRNISLLLNSALASFIERIMHWPPLTCVMSLEQRGLFFLRKSWHEHTHFLSISQISSPVHWLLGGWTKLKQSDLRIYQQRHPSSSRRSRSSSVLSCPNHVQVLAADIDRGKVSAVVSANTFILPRDQVWHTHLPRMSQSDQGTNGIKGSCSTDQ